MGNEMGYVDPSRERFQQFRELPRKGAIHMLNLVRFRDHAVYEDGRKATGAEAYAAYGRESQPVFQRVGGKIAWRGNFEFNLIGPEDEQWDEVFVVEYPSMDAFIEMLRDPIYKEAVKHRQAAVADSRLIRCEPAAAGNKFG
jgi:uncharacterized protein (DUF1330 family)